MTSKEALEEIKDWVEYFTRLDYVEPVVRGEVQQKFKDAYWGTLDYFEKIKKDLEVLKEFERMLDANTLCRICGITGYKIIEIFKSNSVIKNWLENNNEE